MRFAIGALALAFSATHALAEDCPAERAVYTMHSDDDGFVPSDASHDLVVARPDLVELQVFEIARHTKLWNYDQERWTASMTATTSAITHKAARLSATQPKAAVGARGGEMALSDSSGSDVPITTLAPAGCGSPASSAGPDQ